MSPVMTGLKKKGAPTWLAFIATLLVLLAILSDFENCGSLTSEYAALVGEGLAQVGLETPDCKDVPVVSKVNWSIQVVN